MSKNEVKKLVKAFADILKKNRFAFRNIYLFGSQATGKSHEYSDIDIAVVVRRLPQDRGYLDKRMKLRELTIDVDSRIEPILLEERDLNKKNGSIMGMEVLKHGILVV